MVTKYKDQDSFNHPTERQRAFIQPKCSTFLPTFLIVVEIVDQQEKIDRFVELADKMIEEAHCGALITIEKAEVIRYKSRK